MSAHGRPVVLVVDDDPGMRRYLSRTLSRAYEILQAEDGLGCLEVARDLGPDVILLDSNMPRMNGPCTLAELRDDPRTRHIPTLMMSEVDDVGARVRALEGGAVDFLLKPVHPLELRARVGVASRRADGEMLPIARSMRRSSPGIARASSRTLTAGSVDRLTHRERQIVQYLLTGWSDEEVAVRGAISVGTVRSHKARIRRKLGLPAGTRFQQAMTELRAEEAEAVTQPALRSG